MIDGKALTPAEFDAAAQGLRRLLVIIAAGEMIATPASVARLEGAVIALEAAAGRIPDRDEVLDPTSLHETDV